MRSRRVGVVTDNLWYLGREESGVYYLEGKDGVMMINGGLSYILPDVLAQMRDLRLNPARINKFLILHSHFDHVGILPYFKRTYPGIEIMASATAWKILAMPKAIEVMNQFSQLSARQMNASEALSMYDLQWREDISGTTVMEGDRIDLGGVALNIISTPGHSNCSISAYEPTMEALFASDAAGIPFQNTIFPSMNTNVTQFLESLAKLRLLQVSRLCADHYGYISGHEAENFIVRTVEEALKWKSHLEDCYHKHDGDIEAAGRAITDFFYKQMPGYFISPEILEGVFRQMVKYIAKTLQQAD
jgi:2-aminobenzoylacetyl-CoA thioesterase